MITTVALIMNVVTIIMIYKLSILLYHIYWSWYLLINFMYVVILLNVETVNEICMV